MDKFVRTLEPKNHPQLSWEKNKDKRKNFNRLHYGQLKLLLSEIEHLTQVQRRIDLSTATVIYIGAGGGEHIPLLSSLFPKLHFILVDDHFSIQPTNTIEIFYEYASDETIQKYKAHARKNIIFISDMRRGNEENFEKSVNDDNMNQMKWGIQLDAFSMLLKFRLPYPDMYMNTHYTTTIDNSIRNHVVSPKTVPNNTYLYLKGEPKLQAWAPLYSTETRLEVFKRKDNKWSMDCYDPKQYEDACLYFNEITRSSNTSYKESQWVPYHIAGMDNRYDAVGEFYILRSYIYQNQKKNVFANTVKLMKYVHDYMYSSQNMIHKMIYDINQIGKDKDKMDLAKRYIKDIKKYCKYQLKLIQKYRRSSILSIHDYEQQIKILRKEMN